MAAGPVVCYVHDSPIHGRGLIAARDLPARASLGELVGERITAAEFAKRKAAGGACLVRFTDLDGAEVHLDGEGRCPVAHVNSVQGTGLLPNCEFVSDGRRVEVVTLRAVPQGAELLADYAVHALLCSQQQPGPRRRLFRRIRRTPTYSAGRVTTLSGGCSRRYATAAASPSASRSRGTRRAPAAQTGWPS